MTNKYLNLCLNRAPGVRTFEESRIKLDCTPDVIRKRWKASSSATVYRLCPAVRQWENQFHNPPGFRALKRQACAMAGGFFDVEYLGVNRWTGQRVYYANAGDTYATTLIFQAGNLTIGCYGDLVESGAIRETAAY